MGGAPLDPAMRLPLPLSPPIDHPEDGSHPVSMSTDRRTEAGTPSAERASLEAGRAAGYCWVQNPHGPGRCTWPPVHPERRHKDVYAHTEW